MKQYDVLAIGNAIVDALYSVEDDFLIKEKLNKGEMRIVSLEKSVFFRKNLTSLELTSGGSAANTVSGLSALGKNALFVGKVSNDEFGELFKEQLETVGSFYHTPFDKNKDSLTAMCSIFITPDSQRTMCTYLGSCLNLTVDDIFDKDIEKSSVIYLEGYLWDPPLAKEAFVKAASIAHKYGKKVSLTLSDSFCVDRYRDQFLSLITSGQVDIVFANHHELISLFQNETLSQSIKELQKMKVLGIVTESEKGAHVIEGDLVYSIPAYPVNKVVDATGAGDLFAAGFLAAYTENRPYMDCLKLATWTASHVIQKVGPRVTENLKELALKENIFQK